MEVMQPDPIDPDAKQINPFDLFGPSGTNPGGANFKLKIRKNSDGFRSYEKSVFADPASLFEDEDQMEEIWKKAYSLQEIISPDKFKSPEELKERFLKVVGNQAKGGSTGPEASEPEPEPSKVTKQKKTAPEESPPWEEETPALETASGGDDEDLDYFKGIAESE